MVRSAQLILALFFCLTAMIVGQASSAAEVISVQPKKNRVVISQDKDRPWEEDDEVCLFRRERQIGCGHVVTLNKKSAVVEMDKFTDGISKKTLRDSPSFTYLELVFGKSKLARGDRVELAEEKGVAENVKSEGDGEDRMEFSGDIPLVAPTETADAGNKSDDDKKGKPDLFAEGNTEKSDLFMTTSGNEEKTSKPAEEAVPAVDRESKRAPASEVPTESAPVILSTSKPIKSSSDVYPLSNVIVGLNYIFPNVQYQQALSDHFSTGLTAIYVASPIGNGNLSAGGGLVTFNYYTQSSFKGSWMQLGAGYYQATLRQGVLSEDFGTPVAMALFGWRWLWDSGLNFGFAVGGQYLIQSKTANVDVGFSGLLPAISMDLGFAF